MVPTVELPPLTPPADHVTALLERPLVLTVNCTLPLTATDGIDGDTVMLCARDVAESSNMAAAATKTDLWSVVLRCVLTDSSDGDAGVASGYK